MNLVSLIIVIGVLVLLHEGGHFLAARAVKAPVAVFSIGFGKRLFGFRWKETDFRWSLIPLGGYVRVLGLGPDESDVVQEHGERTPLLPRWKRALILLAGPAANVVGAVVFVAAAFHLGVKVPAWQDQPPVVGWVDPTSPAAEAGIRPGDLVRAVDGKKLKTWRDWEMATLSSPERRLTVVVEREGQELALSLKPKRVSRYALGWAGVAPPIPAQVQRVLPGSPAEQAGLRPGDLIVEIDGEPVRHFFDLVRLVGERAGKETWLKVLREGQLVAVQATPRSEAGQGKLGIPIPALQVVRKLPAADAVREAVWECWRMTRDTLWVIGRMVTGKASLRQMSGPIDIARFSGEAARTGLVSLVWLLGVISLQLAIFNLLPIPVLDGGHLLVVGLESVRRRDFSYETKERITSVGFWLIVALIIFVLANDVLKNLPALVPGRPPSP
ncbi:MAG: RIP metalloprotease RseP [Thermoanaerobaculum sp.]|nr:RIP metalloprotease RseP [Thermoanaerobaculum sp.]MDW7968138.1 RIP metalloprotease RseP [Thermoanaerobaculum sp.]